jgi:hypothetical protein
MIYVSVVIKQPSGPWVFSAKLLGMNTYTESWK